MKRVIPSLTVVLLAAAPWAAGATNWGVRTGTRDFGPYSGRGTSFSYTHTGDHHRLSVTSNSFVSSQLYNGYNWYYGGYGLCPTGVPGYTTTTYYLPGYTYTYVTPFPYAYVDRRFGYTYIGPANGGTVISTGTNSGFARAFGGNAVNQDPRLLAAPVVAPPVDAKAPIDAGDELFGQGRFAEAAQMFEQAVKADPADGLARFALAHATFATGDYDKAAAAIRKGTELLPRWGELPMDRRDFYTDQRDFDVQMWALSQHLKLHPNDANARLVLAYNYYFTRQPQAAQAELQKLLDGNPQDAAAAYFMKYLKG